VFYYGVKKKGGDAMVKARKGESFETQQQYKSYFVSVAPC
jgi:hypothetical protein